jgi:hypothetical protein
MKKIILAILLLFGSTQLIKAQGEGKFDVGLSVKNMHYWRGLRVSDGLVTAPTIGYYKGGFSAYVWGGMSVNGSYREVSHIISYETGGFNITLLDIFNFSGQENPEFLNYDKEETIHLVDLSVGYHFGESFPLNIKAATILYGNDRLASGEARYSTYLEAGYRFSLHNTKIEPFMAIGTALAADAASGLYTGDQASGIVQIGLMVSKKVESSLVSFPVDVKLGYNPALNESAIEISIGIF